MAKSRISRRKGDKHINAFIHVAPYVAGILSILFAYIKWSNNTLRKDIDRYHDMWTDTLKSVEELNNELIKEKEEIRKVKDENIELESKNKRLKEKNSELIAQLADYERKNKNE